MREYTQALSVSGRYFAALTLCLVLSAPFCRTARAEYPDHIVKIVVPFPAGGTADAVPRIIADWLSHKWDSRS